jgi:iron(III) transport system permease protein
MRRRFASTLIGIALGVFLLIFVGYPVVNGIAASFLHEGDLTLRWFTGMIDGTSSSTIDAVLNSVVVSALTVLIGGVLGILLSLALALERFPLRRLASAAAVVPIAMPPLVGVIALLFVFGEGGILPRVLGGIFGVEDSFFAMEGFAGILAVHVYSFHVYTLLFVSSALRQIDRSIIEAATGFGARSSMVFLRVVVPELAPALIGAGSLTFMSSMASFSAPLLLGGGMPFLTTTIYSSKLNGDIALAGAQSTLLLAVSVCFFLLLNISTRRSRTGIKRKGVVSPWTPAFSRGAERTLTGAGMVILVLEILPVLAIILISFAREGSWTWQLLPAEYTVENYAKLLANPDVFRPMGNSLIMSLLSVATAALVGTILAFAITRGFLKKVRDVADPLLTSCFAIPGTVVAIYLILAFAEPRWLTAGGVLLGTFWILPLAYFIRTYPLILRSATSSLDSLDPSITEAAEMFGASTGRILFNIILPVVFPAILAGSLLALVNSLGEFPSSILLFAHSNRPVSVEILSQLRGYNFGSAGAYAVGLLVLVLGFSYLSGKLSDRGEGNRFHF